MAARLNTWAESLPPEYDGDGEVIAPRQWRANNLRRMLASPSTQDTGPTKVRQSARAPGSRCCTADEHDRLVALFSNRVVSRGSAPNHLLSGIAECAVCGGRLYVRSSGYGCDRGHVGRAEAKVDRAVTEVIAALLSDPVSLAKLAAPFPPTPAPPPTMA